LFQAEDGIRDLVRSRGLGDVYKRQGAEPMVWWYCSLDCGWCCSRYHETNWGALVTTELWRFCEI